MSYVFMFLITRNHIYALCFWLREPIYILYVSDYAKPIYMLYVSDYANPYKCFMFLITRTHIHALCFWLREPIYMLYVSDYAKPYTCFMFLITRNHIHALCFWLCFGPAILLLTSTPSTRCFHLPCCQHCSMYCCYLLFAVCLVSDIVL